MRYRLLIAYDGTSFHGWQRQPKVSTVQRAVESALTQMNAGTPMTIDGASRTDAGVHAQGQLAAFTYDGKLTAQDFLRGLNALTPSTVTIRAVDPVEDDYHPRFASRGKRYRYLLWQTKRAPPSLCSRVWITPRPIHVEPMHRAAQALLGEHDFSAFRASDCDARTPTRTISRITVETLPSPYDFPLEIEANALIAITVEGKAFLKYMVRIIAGTLYEVGCEQRTVASVAEALAARDRTLAGRTAPACGLTLIQVFV